MAIESHRLVVGTHTRGRGPKKAVKIVRLPTSTSFLDAPDPTVEGEVYLVSSGDSSVQSGQSQLAQLYVAVDLPGTGLAWVRVSVTVSGQDQRTGRSWNHIAKLRKGT